jgi:hypothetical protein
LVVVGTIGGPTPVTVASALGLDGPDPPGWQERREGAIAMLTAACLRRAGLEVVPVLDPPPPIPDPDLDPVAWAERWGFGVATSVGAAGVGAAVPGPTDPNLEAARRAGGAAEQRYLAALRGHDGQPGCQQQASEIVLGLRERLLQPLEPALARLAGEIDADPAMAAIVDAWRVCVRPVAGTLADGPRAAVGPAMLERAAKRLADWDGSPAALAAIQADERREASVVARCEAAYAGGRTRIATRHETPFVRAHATELAAIQSALEREEAAWPTMPP